MKCFSQTPPSLSRSVNKAGWLRKCRATTCRPPPRSLGGLGRPWAALGGLGRPWAALGGLGRPWAAQAARRRTRVGHRARLAVQPPSPTETSSVASLLGSAEMLPTCQLSYSRATSRRSPRGETRPGKVAAGRGERRPSALVRDSWFSSAPPILSAWALHSATNRLDSSRWRPLTSISRPVMWTFSRKSSTQLDCS